jgi:hypothetical protein
VGGPMSESAEGSFIPVFGVPRRDPGSIYIVEDSNRFKIGKTKNASARFKAAKTWLPNMKLHGCKPFWNVSEIERCLHVGFSIGWFAGEWFSFGDDNDRDLLLEGFLEFSDHDRDANSVDFIYWFNSNGMAEFVIEQNEQRLTLPKFLKQESWNLRSKG